MLRGRDATWGACSPQGKPQCCESLPCMASGAARGPVQPQRTRAPGQGRIHPACKYGFAGQSNAQCRFENRERAPIPLVAVKLTRDPLESLIVRRIMVAKGFRGFLVFPGISARLPWAKTFPCRLGDLKRRRPGLSGGRRLYSSELQQTRNLPFGTLPGFPPGCGRGY
jgi:hypothetical protein